MATTRTRQHEDEEEEETTLLISHHNEHNQSSSSSSQEHEEEEETLSLCDLPTENLQSQTQSKQEEQEEDFEFEIGSSFRLGSDQLEPVVTPADELFFKGQILPFRHSVSDPIRFITRSESVKLNRDDDDDDDNYQTGINNFIDYSQPSPNPQIIRRSSSMTARVRNSKSNSIWDFLRLGLVRTPEIELRTGSTGKLSVSRNSSCSSTSTGSNSRSRNRRRSFLFNDCKCSVATETSVVPTRVSVSCNEKKKTVTKKEEKTAIARKRTFEWLKELSQVG